MLTIILIKYLYTNMLLKLFIHKINYDIFP